MKKLFILFVIITIASTMILGCSLKTHTQNSQSKSDEVVKDDSAVIIAFTDEYPDIYFPLIISKAEEEDTYNSKNSSTLLTKYLTSNEFQSWVDNDWLFNYGIECKIRDSRSAFDKWIEGIKLYTFSTDNMKDNIYIDEKIVDIVNYDKVKKEIVLETDTTVKEEIFNSFINLTNDGDVAKIIGQHITNVISGK